MKALGWRRYGRAVRCGVDGGHSERRLRSLKWLSEGLELVVRWLNSFCLGTDTARTERNTAKIH